MKIIGARGRKDLAKKVSLLNDMRRIPAHPGTLADDVERALNTPVAHKVPDDQKDTSVISGLVGEWIGFDNQHIEVIESKVCYLAAFDGGSSISKINDTDGLISLKGLLNGYKLLHIADDCARWQQLRGDLTFSEGALQNQE